MCFALGYVRSGVRHFRHCCLCFAFGCTLRHDTPHNVLCARDKDEYTYNYLLINCDRIPHPFCMFCFTQALQLLCKTCNAEHRPSRCNFYHCKTCNAEHRLADVPTFKDSPSCAWGPPAICMHLKPRPFAHKQQCHCHRLPFGSCARLARVRNPLHTV